MRKPHLCGSGNKNILISEGITVQWHQFANLKCLPSAISMKKSIYQITSPKTVQPQSMAMRIKSTILEV